MRHTLRLNDLQVRQIGGGKININENPYLWARNLLANRLYQCPVIFLEPYVMNNKEVHDRVQLGDYQGTKPINGVEKKSIYREYADAVTLALNEYYLENRVIYEPEEEEALEGE